MAKVPTSFQQSYALGRRLLRDRRTRRRILHRLLLVTLALVLLGTWPLGHWLEGGALRFALWWGMCLLCTLHLFLFALYDALHTMAGNR